MSELDPTTESIPETNPVGGVDTVHSPGTLHSPGSTPESATDGGQAAGEPDDLQRLARLLARARALAGEGGLSPAARDRQKWAAGDLIAAMAKIVEGARDRLLDPGIPVDSHARARFRACSDVYDGFLGGQGLTRGSLVDAALTATVFPPGDPVRTGPLSFSHARTLSRLDSPRDRTAWAARAVEGGLSVARLQALINTQPQSNTQPTINTLPLMDTPSPVPPGGITSTDDVAGGDYAEVFPPASRSVTGTAGRGRRHHLHVCAFTGEAITDITAMVEVRLHLDGPGRDTLAARYARQSPRGGAARGGQRGDGGGDHSTYPSLLRFASLSVLAQWLAAREQRAEQEADGSRADEQRSGAGDDPPAR